jgi:hypothetical protein
MTQHTKWEKFNFIELQEIASDDDMIVRNEAEILDYLKSRSYDLEFEVLSDGQYNVIFA